MQCANHLKVDTIENKQPILFWNWTIELLICISKHLAIKIKNQVRKNSKMCLLNSKIYLVIRKWYGILFSLKNSFPIILNEKNLVSLQRKIKSTICCYFNINLLIEISFSPFVCLFLIKTNKLIIVRRCFRSLECSRKQSYITKEHDFVNIEVLKSQKRQK